MEGYKEREIKALKSKINEFESYVMDIRNGIGSIINEPDSEKVGKVLIDLLNIKKPRM